MIEAEWLESSDPWSMLQYLRRIVSANRMPRKLRLFSCALWRQTWLPVTDDLSLRMVAIAEQFADGVVSRKRLHKARAITKAEFSDAMKTTGVSDRGKEAAPDAVRVAAVCLERNISVEHLSRGLLIFGCGSPAGRACAAGIVRDLFGNPFCPVYLDLSFLRWNESIIPNLAQEIYNGRSFSILPMLADALEEAGIGNEELLRHCREPGSHERGCWALDLLLGKG